MFILNLLNNNFYQLVILIDFVWYTEFLSQALGKTLGTGDDDGDQDVIDKFLSVRQ